MLVAFQADLEEARAAADRAAEAASAPIQQPAVRALA